MTAALVPVRPDRVVGGMFGLADLAARRGPRGVTVDGIGATRDRIEVTSGRGAVALALALLGARRVWLPSFLCPVLVRAVAPARIGWYPIDGRLRVADDTWVRRIRPGDLVLGIDYFGAPFDPALGGVVERGAWLLEDAAQAQHCPGQAPADLVVRSPRKWFGIADGATLEARSERGAALLVESGDLPSPDSSWLVRSRTAAARRAQFDHGGGPPDWYSAFRRAEETVPIEPQAMSAASSRRLAAIEADATTLREAVAARLANGRRLLDGLGGRAVIPDLVERGVPIGIPVRLESRDGVRDGLARERIFAPIHWRLGKAVPARFHASHDLVGEILTLPCDERATLDDMDRTLLVIGRAGR